MSELDNATSEVTTEQVDEVIKESLGFDPGEPEPEPEEQPEAPEEQPEPDETPAAEPEVKPDAEPVAEEPETTIADDDGKPESDFTPRETALYARMKKYQEAANGNKDEASVLKERLAKVEGQVSVLDRQVEPEPELVNPLDGLEDWENPTAGQLRDYEVYQTEKATRQVSKQRQEQEERVDRYLRETDNVGNDFYDDWNEVITPAIGAAIKADPQKTREVLMAGSTVKAAKVAYRIAKELSSGKKAEALAPAAPPPKKPDINNKPAPSIAEKQDLIAARISHALDSAQTEEQIDTLLQQLDALGVK